MKISVQGKMTESEREALMEEMRFRADNYEDYFVVNIDNDKFYVFKYVFTDILGHHLLCVEDPIDNKIWNFDPDNSYEVAVLIECCVEMECENYDVII